MRTLLKQLAKGVLRTCGNLSYVESAAKYITNQRNAPTYEIPEITPIRVEADARENLRLNLFIPSINVSDSFGGIFTAVKLFEQLGDILRAESDIQMRIITHRSTTDESVVDLTKWKLGGPQKFDAPYQVIELKDPQTEAISFSRRDVFVATWWSTALRAARLRAWQERSFGRAVAPLIYIIQDFEPAFYPWSSKYAFAEATYLDASNTIAIFNSSLLRSFCEKQGYSFLKTYHFEPKINNSIKMHLKQNASKERRILVYGRPSIARNCFEAICAGLREWARTSAEARRWSVISAGEKHPNIQLGNELEMRSVGKLSLEAYGALLSDCAIGISLMLSPHPSYPPLEMAHSGILTITNSYADKDLSTWHDNIYSLSRLVPEELAKAIDRCVKKFEEDNTVGWKGRTKVPFYLRDDQADEFLYDVAREIMMQG